MSLLNNIRKTINYAGRNGCREAYYAAAERLGQIRGASYSYDAPLPAQLRAQRSEYAEWEAEQARAGGERLPLISILVPLYMPKEEYLRAMIESVLAQTFGNYEVVFADGSTDSAADAVISSYKSEKFTYHMLGRNGGISYNTNAAAQFARGDYVAFLDYDDLLTPDAVCRVSRVILESHPEIIYSDEDKCDAKGRKFFEPNIKPDFNRDYLLTNNYICHFLVMKRELFLALGLRSDYDGAQDYDLMLRAPWSHIRHIPAVLYHWRTHSGSTAGNPASKNYAYEAGRRALEDYLRCGHIEADVEDSRHRGFYRIVYHPDIFTQRGDVGVVGGRIVDRHHRVVGGMMREDGTLVYGGMHEMESGPMHRADTVQDAEAVDVRCMQIRDNLRDLYQTVFNSSYENHVMKQDESLRAKSIEFCRLVRKMGYLVVYDPSITHQIR
ncbi:MAG: glycosyltransferase [Lachnospiraceae bacterium]|nr:glycosyltransferase [Lachnospiraceae bacterium]